MDAATKEQSTGPHFTWTDRDTAALLSVNIPLQSRLSRSRKTGVRRNVKAHVGRPSQQISLNTSGSLSASLRAHLPLALDRCKGGTIDSPRKVVKKLCLGPEWRITDWDRARNALQRKPAQAPSTDLTEMLETSEELASSDPASDQAVPEDSEQQSEWEDLSDDDNIGGGDDGDACKDGMHVSIDPSTATDQSQSILDKLLEALGSSVPVDAAESGTLSHRSTPRSTRSSLQGSPVRRISIDDKAILQAFISRATSNRRLSATAKRESIENKRDSNAIRLAMTSPARVQILTELDPNSPLPQSAISNSPVKQSTENATETPETKEQPTDRPRATRRSARSKPQSQNDIGDTATQANEPNKIAFRGSAKRMPLRDCEKRSLQIETRSNTKKNAAKSVSVKKRLSMLASDDQTHETNVEAAIRKASEEAKAVGWNPTLVFYQDGTSLVDDGRDGNDVVNEAPVLDVSDTPRGRRAKGRKEQQQQQQHNQVIALPEEQSANESAVPEDTVEEAGKPTKQAKTESAATNAVTQTPSRPTQRKSRIASRIATPAGGLLKRTKAAPTTTTTPAAGINTDASKSTTSSRRTKPPITTSAPAPNFPVQKLKSEISAPKDSQASTAYQPQPEPEPEPKPASAAVMTTPRKQPVFDPPIPARKNPAQTSTTVPLPEPAMGLGLSSPAKRRPIAPSQSEGGKAHIPAPSSVRSLSSPAKRPVGRKMALGNSVTGGGGNNNTTGDESGLDRDREGRSPLPPFGPVSLLQSPAKRRPVRAAAGARSVGRF